MSYCDHDAGKDGRQCADVRALLDKEKSPQHDHIPARLQDEGGSLLQICDVGSVQAGQAVDTTLCGSGHNQVLMACKMQQLRQLDQFL